MKVEEFDEKAYNRQRVVCTNCGDICHPDDRHGLVGLTSSCIECDSSAPPKLHHKILTEWN